MTGLSGSCDLVRRIYRLAEGMRRRGGAEAARELRFCRRVIETARGVRGECSGRVVTGRVFGWSPGVKLLLRCRYLNRGIVRAAILYLRALLGGGCEARIFSAPYVYELRACYVWPCYA